jgi:hypothetical protein
MNLKPIGTDLLANPRERNWPDRFAGTWNMTLMKIGPHCPQVRLFQLCLAVIALSILPGCKQESAPPPPVAVNLKTWERPLFVPGGGNAMILYVVYGKFPEEAEISRSKYRTAGVPPGVTLQKVGRAEKRVLPFTEGDFAKILRTNNPALFARFEQAAECIVLQGEVADPANLNYLRDCIGVVTYFMDHGGLIVTDAQQLKFYDAAEWRRTFFEPEQPNLLRHASILLSEEEAGGGHWFHTRGLRKFGRPDLSLRHVGDEYEKASIDLCNRFIEFQVSGGRIQEGQEVRVPTLPGGLVCRHKGNLDDPDFNNVHVEIQFPSGR